MQAPYDHTLPPHISCTSHAFHNTALSMFKVFLNIFWEGNHENRGDCHQYQFIRFPKMFALKRSFQLFSRSYVTNKPYYIKEIQGKANLKLPFIPLSQNANQRT
jgi:hypothetical protein